MIAIRSSPGTTAMMAAIWEKKFDSFDLTAMAEVMNHDTWRHDSSTVQNYVRTRCLQQRRFERQK